MIGRQAFLGTERFADRLGEHWGYDETIGLLGDHFVDTSGALVYDACHEARIVVPL